MPSSAFWIYFDLGEIPNVCLAVKSTDHMVVLFLAAAASLTVGDRGSDSSFLKELYGTLRIFSLAPGDV